LKARLNLLEQSLKPKGKGSKKDPKEAWKERVKRHAEMNRLDDLVIAGDLKACIRNCELCPESLIERTYKYRDSIVKIAGGDLNQKNNIDLWHENLKATYHYLEEKVKGLITHEPVLKTLR
jgi:hypothetical protein